LNAVVIEGIWSFVLGIAGKKGLSLQKKKIDDHQHLVLTAEQMTTPGRNQGTLADIKLTIS